MQRGWTVQFAESRRAADLAAVCRAHHVERRAPAGSILFVNQLRDRYLAEVGIAEQLSAVKKRPAKGLDRQVNAIGGAVAELRETVALKNVQRFQHRDPAGTRRRSADNLVSAIRPADRLPLFHLVRRKVFGGDQPAVALHLV